MKRITLIFLFLFLLSACKQEPHVLDINLREHVNLALHIHPILEIEILGEPYIIPADTGISSEGMRVIHTHDETGKLHVEGPYPYDFVLGDFFTIWGKNFNSTCIFQYCENENYDLKMYVNGIESEEFENLLLLDRDLIQIVYEEKNEVE